MRIPSLILEYGALTIGVSIVASVVFGYFGLQLDSFVRHLLP